MTTLDLHLNRVKPSQCYAKAVHRVLSVVGEVTETPVSTILGDSRKAGASFARHVAMYCALKTIKITLAALGEQLDRDHTTIVHARASITRRLKVDPVVQKTVRTVLERLAVKDGVKP
jgi:chromosomal replication initiator protein